LRKRIKKYILYAGLVTALTLAAATSVVWLYQDEVIALFVRELNKNLRTPVEVGRIELSLFDKFPNVALSFRQVTIQGALEQDSLPLARAERLYLAFDIWDLFGGNYAVHQVFLENADVRIVLDKKGEPNYEIFHRDSTRTSGGKPVNFDLHKIQLDRVNVVYTDQKNDQEYALFTEKSDASLHMQADNLLIALDGEVRSHYIRLEKLRYFAGKDLELESQLVYNLQQRHLTIKPSTVSIKKARFSVAGTFANYDQGDIDLLINGKNTDIQTLISLLPAQYADQLSIYRSKGKVYFDSQIKGSTFNGAVPVVQVQFGCQDASFYHADAGKTIEQAYLTGRFSNGEKRTQASSTLSLSNIRGQLDGRPFSGEFSMQNFTNPHLAFSVRGELDAASLLAFYPLPEIKSARGLLNVDVAFEGKLTDLRSKATTRFARTSGTIYLKDLSIGLKNKPWEFAGVNGDFLFDKSDLQINDLTGKAGNSDFHLNGFFKNVLAYLFFRDQDLKIEATFQSRLLDLDELLAADEATARASADTGDEKYEFTLSPRLAFDLVCSIDQLRFRRFRAHQIGGNLSLNDQIASSKGIRLATASGWTVIDGTVNGRQADRIAVDCHARFDQLAIDSVFYMFENFSQDFIQDRHLKGKVNADVQTYMVFDRYLDMNVPSLLADVRANISNGELNNFEPMQRLSKFIDRTELANIRFSDLDNTFRIENRTVFIPQMEIRSNVTNISVKGTHTFDQVMDYRLRIPLYTFIGRRTRMATDAGGEAEGVTNLFVAVTGTSDDYKIAYDKESAREKRRDDWQQEKQEFRNLLKGKKETEKEKEAQSLPKQESEEEFFDWD
jgi:hypothetical protein